MLKVEPSTQISAGHAALLKSSTRFGYSSREELADVLLYLIRLADKLDIDLTAAAFDKMAVNAKKYPVHKARGTSKKYTDL